MSEDVRQCTYALDRLASPGNADGCSRQLNRTDMAYNNLQQ
jgi:hypothetical protein